MVPSQVGGRRPGWASDRSTRRGPLALSVGWSLPARGYLCSTLTTDLYPEAVPCHFRSGWRNHDNSRFSRRIDSSVSTLFVTRQGLTRDLERPRRDRFSKFLRKISLA